MRAILGISAFYHDAAAALIVDGEIVAAAQEERFTRVKHDHRFPQAAIDYCLASAGLTAKDLDYVGFYEKPLSKFDRLLETYLAFAPAGLLSFSKAMPQWLKEKLHLPKIMRKGLPGYKRRFVFCEHHESHAASAFFPSPYEQAAVLTLDGVGEWHTGSFGVGRGNHLELQQVMQFPHSRGLLYSAFTYFCGFRVNSGEYKLMGLAPYGEARFAALIKRELLDLKADGSFRLNLKYFSYCQGLTMTNGKFAQLFGGPPRQPESALTQREMDLAASIQQVTEEIVLAIGRHVHKTTGMRNLCMAGGVALNCVANGRLLREGPFDDIFVQPAAGDAGGALGVALLIWHQLLAQPRTARPRDAMHGARLGPQLQGPAIESMLVQRGAVFEHFVDEAALLEQVAALIAAGKVVGWVQGRMEFGPRALGARSILGDPRSTEMQSTMNLKIKFRESFRPFAPSVLEERTQDYFELKPGQQSPYMLIVAPVAQSQRLEPSAEQLNLAGIDQLKAQRSKLPAVTHVDYSARVQTVDAERHGRYHRLLQAFERQTGCAVLINTSFNVRGEPIVCSAEDAYRCFMGTNMDVLVLEDYVLLKSAQANAELLRNESYLAEFALD